MEIAFLIIGICIGFSLAWFIAKSTNKKPDEITNLNKTLNQNNIALNVEKEKNKLTNNQLIKSQNDLTNEREKSIELNTMLSTRNAEYKSLSDKLINQKNEIENLHQKLNEQFRNLANTIIEEKSEKFTKQNKENIDQILKPLNEKLKDFEKKIEDTYDKNVKDRVDLQVEVRKLFELNSKISQEANNLTKALKGDVKKQGNWGEVILERILENSGLTKGREYKTQVSFNRLNGGSYRPDAVIYLPENKHIIIDSKVSLIAYNNYINSENKEEQDNFIKLHIQSVKNHITELSNKEYHKLEQLSSPEYVLLFIPIESSFGLAIAQDVELFNYAWNNKIIIVSPSTLTATLMTVASIWQHENQTKNAIEIAEKSGDLYDKFTGLLEDILDIGQRLNQTQKAYDSSINKLTQGRGNLIKRAEDLKKLGAKASKIIPHKFTKELDKK